MTFFSRSRMLLALAAASLLTGCGQGVEVDGLAPPSAPAPQRLRAPGRSLDLLCAVNDSMNAESPSLPENVTATRLDCRQRGRTFEVHHVAVEGDRRRSVLLPAGTALRLYIAPEGAEWLRFSIAAVAAFGESDATAPRLRLAVSDDAGSMVTWERSSEPGPTAWVDGEVDLSELSPQRCLLELEVEPAAGGSIAFAAPRLITPDNPEARGLPAANAVVYLSDTLRPDHMSLYGYERPTTPNIDRLASAGVVFENAYSTAAWTRPATASLLTSLYPRFHGSDEIHALPARARTLAERFRAAGFSTLAVVANANIYSSGLGFEQGFDRFIAVPSLPAGAVHERLLPHLEAMRSEPFFLYVHTIDPHSPYDPPEGYRGVFTDPDYGGYLKPKTARRKFLKGQRIEPDDLAFVRGLYDEEIRYQDAMVGELFERFGELGLDERLVFVFTSDHGEEFHEHGDWEHGWRLFEEQVRIPLWIGGAALGPSGRRITEPVQILDVMPTLLAWFGIGGLEGCQGWNLDGVLTAEGELREAWAERPIYCEEIRYGIKYDLYSLMRGSSKIIRYTSPKDLFSWHRLFDLDADPSERRNRARGANPQLDRLRRELDAIPRQLAGRFEAFEPAVAPELDRGSRRQLEALGYLDGPGGKD